MDTYTKVNVTPYEYALHAHIENIENIENIKCPKLITYDIFKSTLVMEKINGLNVSDFYGENAKDVPNNVFERIQDIIITLYNNNIIYPDITGYNFILDNIGELWIIDFEHAVISENIKEDIKKYPFVMEFINGSNEWNPDFL